MIIQDFFPGMGVEHQAQTHLAVAEEQIESVNRLRRHALKIKNWQVVTECDKELAQLGETARALRQLLMPAAGQAAKARLEQGCQTASEVGACDRGNG